MSLTTTLSSISYTLGNSRSAWEDQRNAVKKLRDLCSQYGNMFKANYIDVNIKLGLIRCVGDNRSGLVIEACGAICDLCNTIGQSLESAASDIFLNIIEKAASGVSTISSAVTECCVNMVKFLHMEKVIVNLERFLKHKSDKVQITAATCLKLIISYWPESLIRKHHQHLINLITVGVKASRSEVRALMRDSQDLITQKMGGVVPTTPSKPSYSNPRGISTPSTSTAIKSMPTGPRNVATPRGVEMASMKTGIAPRNVVTPKYTATRTAPHYVSDHGTMTPTQKTATSRIIGSSAKSTYSGLRSPNQTPVPRKNTNLSATPIRSMYEQAGGDPLARLDRELENIAVDQKTLYNIYQRVRVRGQDGKLHSSMIQYIGRTKGTKKVVYGVFFQDGYRPEGNGTFHNRHYAPKDALVSDYVFEADIIPLPSTPNKTVVHTQRYNEPHTTTPVAPRYSKQEVEQTMMENMRETSENMKKLVMLMKDFHVVENQEETRSMCASMMQLLKNNIKNTESMIEKIQNLVLHVC